MADPTTATARREELKQVFAEARVCERCPQLAQTRTQVVFGAGNADADLMFVGEAPGRDEDLQGVPFVGRAGKLLTELLGEIGIAREDVFIANVLKCRPPDNRDPAPGEIEHCRQWLWRQLELIQPTVVVTLGNFATKLLRGEPTGITRLHGQVEVRRLGSRAVRLMPSYHPAAALYNASQRPTIAADFAQIPSLLAQGPPPQAAEAPAAAGEPAAGDDEGPSAADIEAAYAAFAAEDAAEPVNAGGAPRARGPQTPAPAAPARAPAEPGEGPDAPSRAPTQLGLF